MTMLTQTIYFLIVPKEFIQLFKLNNFFWNLLKAEYHRAFVEFHGTSNSSIILGHSHKSNPNPNCLKESIG